MFAGASPPSFVWGGDGFMGAQTHLPQKINFSSDFGQFISKMLENAKFANVTRKKILKYHNVWGDASPRPPAFDAHECLACFCNLTSLVLKDITFDFFLGNI